MHGKRMEMQIETKNAFCRKRIETFFFLLTLAPQKFFGVMLRRAEMPASAGEMIDQGGIPHRRVDIVLNGDDGNAVLLVGLLQKSVDFLLAVRIHAGGRLVENQQIRLADQRARNHTLCACPPRACPCVRLRTRHAETPLRQRFTALYPLTAKYGVG